MCALPSIFFVTYSVAKVLYQRSFSYTRVALSALSLLIGHDLSKGGHNLNRKYVMSREELKEENNRRKYKRSEISPSLESKVSSLLIFIVSQFIDEQALKARHIQLYGKSIEELIQYDVPIILEGMITQDIWLKIYG